MSAAAFFSLSDRLCDGLQVGKGSGEVLFCGLDGEASDFVRLNKGRIRQAGAVHSQSLDLTLISGARQVTGGCDLSGDPQLDLTLAQDLLGRLRERLPQVPEDPYLNVSEVPSAGEHLAESRLPAPAEALGELVSVAEGLDLVGIWASGDIYHGLASSLGHRHWHAGASFNLDWSCYLGGDKAVKAAYAGTHWDPAVLSERLLEVRRALAVMARPARSIPPGRYRAYLAPQALKELTDMLGWGGFDLKSHRTHQTPLLRLVRGELALHPGLGLYEDHARGLVQRFTGEGFLTPDRVDLIAGGVYRDCLVDARSGKEYGVEVNASGESPESLGMDPGDIPRAQALARLGEGLAIGNLWYCNWSDPNDCRVTGMTRFATFWVEGGEPVAPVAVMRFDDSLYHLLGDRLEGLTRERELLLSADTYGGRGSESCLLPGALVDGLTLTL
jgi:predicted Zn-dependent protease